MRSEGVLAIVPARGGSKGIVRKNIRELAGCPLIAHTIRSARDARSVSRIVCSTDDVEIARTAERYGAEVPFMRPIDLAGDYTPDLPVFQHCLRWLADREGYYPEIVVHLRPTAPLRTGEHIDAAVALLKGAPDADSVRSVCAVSQHPLKMWRVVDGWLSPFIDGSTLDMQEPFNQPRQRLPEALAQNGAVDVVRAATIVDQQSMTGRRIRAYVMDELDSVNIDSPLDWMLAERLLEARIRQG